MKRWVQFDEEMSSVLRGPELGRMVDAGDTDLILVVASVGVNDISQREQGKNQGLNPGIGQLLRGWWEKTEKGWPENEPGEQGHRSKGSRLSRRKAWRAVSNVMERWSKTRTEKCPLYLVTSDLWKNRFSRTRTRSRWAERVGGEEMGMGNLDFFRNFSFKKTRWGVT